MTQIKKSEGLTDKERAEIFKKAGELANQFSDLINTEKHSPAVVMTALSGLAAASCIAMSEDVEQAIHNANVFNLDVVFRVAGHFSTPSDAVLQ